MEQGIIGSIDIGGTKVAVTIATRDGVLCRRAQPTRKTGTEEALPEQVAEMLQSACKESGASRLDAVGVSSAGPFASIDGQLTMISPNICGGLSADSGLANNWLHVPLERVLRRHFERLVICNDAVAALQAERMFGAVKDEPDCIYVTWSTGVGFGLCVDGKLLGGKHGNAGHAGHMLMSETSDALCGCGNRGDLEGMISGRNLERRFGHSTVEIFNAARRGDQTAHALVLDAARWLGRALYNLTVVLDTRRIVIGGSVWEHHADWLSPFVQQEISSRMAALTRDVEVLSAGLGPLVADIGALSLVLPPEWKNDWVRNRPWQPLLEQAS